ITKCMEKDPAQRYQTMDELVNALIGVYRTIAGPGMSTYMEAFPVGSAQHMAQPTPPPMTGMVGAVSAAHAATPSPYQSQPVMPVASGQGASGLYDPAGSSVVTVPKKSSTGIIIALVILLAAGGGIAAVVLLG